MQLQDVAFADHKIARYHDSVCLSFAPNTSIFETICEIAMDFFGDTQNSASFCNNVWIGKVRFLSRRLCIDPDDIQEIVHESLECFYLVWRCRQCGNGCQWKSTGISLLKNRQAVDGRG